MSLNAAIELILAEYPSSYGGTFANHPVAAFVRNEFAHAIRSVIGHEDRYIVQGSPGQGNWARSPWGAVFDRLITDTAQEGYYLVYLFREDFSGVYLSLNQGVTSIREQYGTDAKRALTVRANDFVARLGSSSTNLIQGRIDLAVSAASSLGAYYEYGAICSVYYAKENLPTDEVLSSDLSLFLKLYTTLASCDSSLFKQADIEDDETFFGDEQLLVLREHKRIERNKKLAAQAKKVHGSVCKACGFDFAVNYGSIGKGFIEAHHLTPLATLKGAKVKLDARQDFTVLCANCHRMIHKSAFVGSVEEFRASHLRGPMV